jgi:hypothetical protein
MLRQQRHVLGALAQRRNGDDVEGEAVEQVAAEAAGLGKARQVDIGGGDDADIDVLHLVAADALEAAILDDAQDLLLHRQRGGGDLVEKQRSAIGDLEAREAPPRRAGEGAGLVTEELAVEQALGQGGAVELDERLVPARREIGQPRRHQLLAGAALAHHQHRPVEGGELRDLRQSGAEGRRLADEPRQVVPAIGENCY